VLGLDWTGLDVPVEYRDGLPADFAFGREGDGACGFWISMRTPTTCGWTPRTFDSRVCVGVPGCLDGTGFASEVNNGQCWVIEWAWGVHLSHFDIHHDVADCFVGG
jgi:hypothetical protein